LKAADALSLYRDAPFHTRAFLRGRVLLSDLDLVESHVPRGGEVLDLGCGHGLFANLMALRSPGRQVTGIDLSAARIEQARATVGQRPNIRFVCGDMLEAELPICDVVTIVDVMYLLPARQQQEVLDACRKQLKPGGLLVWKAQERKPRWKYAWTYLQELLTTSAGITEGKRARLCFLSREEALSALRQAGFDPRAVDMPSWRPYSDVLYLASA
jgi:2-polyprenyl-6-hydroxyphenyl methylase/3-demethylubiquinone-9 3-methyltransferase